MKVTAIICPKSGYRIFSRSRHDLRGCPCQCGISIDGGDLYVRIGYKDVLPETIEIEIPQTKEELYNDWNTGKDKFGFIKPKKNKKKQ